MSNSDSSEMKTILNEPILFRVALDPPRSQIFYLTTSRIYLLPQVLKKKTLNEKKLLKVCNHLYDLQKIVTKSHVNISLEFKKKELTLETNKTNFIIEQIYSRWITLTLGYPKAHDLVLEIGPPKRKIRILRHLKKLRKKTKVICGHGYLETYKAWCTYYSSKRNLLFEKKILMLLNLPTSHLDSNEQESFQKRKVSLNSNQSNIPGDREFRLDRNLRREFNLLDGLKSNYDLRPIFHSLRFNTWFDTLILNGKTKKKVLTLVTELFETNRTITKLVIRSCDCSGEELAKLSQAIKKNPFCKLRELDFSGWKLNLKSIYTLLDALSTLRFPLKVLKLGAKNIKENLTTKFFSFLAKHPSLRSIQRLSLNGFKLATEGTRSLMSWVHNPMKNSTDNSNSNNEDNEKDLWKVNTNCNSLSLPNCEINVYFLLSSLPSLLNKLSLSGINLLNRDVDILNDFLAKSLALGSLNLSNCSLTIQSIEKICKTISNSKTLAHLYLNFDDNKLKLIGAKIIAVNLYSAKQIESLSLCNVDFDYSAIALIAASLIDNPSLKKLSLSNNKSTSDNKQHNNDNGNGKGSGSDYDINQSNVTNLNSSNNHSSISRSSSSSSISSNSSISSISSIGSNNNSYIYSYSYSYNNSSINNNNNNENSALGNVQKNRQLAVTKLIELVNSKTCQLNTLKIDNCHFGRSIGKMFAVLTRNKSLTKLDISQNNLDDETLAALFAALRKNKTIIKLNWKGNKPNKGKRSMRELSNTLMDNYKLQSFKGSLDELLLNKSKKKLDPKIIQTIKGMFIRLEENKNAAKMKKFDDRSKQYTLMRRFYARSISRSRQRRLNSTYQKSTQSFSQINGLENTIRYYSLSFSGKEKFFTKNKLIQKEKQNNNNNNGNLNNQIINIKKNSSSLKRNLNTEDINLLSTDELEKYSNNVKLTNNSFDNEQEQEQVHGQIQEQQKEKENENDKEIEIEIEIEKEEIGNQNNNNNKNYNEQKKLSRSQRLQRSKRSRTTRTPRTIKPQVSSVDFEKHRKKRKRRLQVENKREKKALELEEKVEKLHLISKEQIPITETFKYALEKCDLITIKKLFKKKKASLNMIEIETRKSPLHFACEIGNSELLSFLLNLEQGPRYMNTKDIYGRTPLHILNQTSLNLDCVHLLSDFEADFNITDRCGSNALHLLIRNFVLKTEVNNETEKMNKLLDLIIKKGCNYNAVDNKGKSPLQIACAKGYVQAIQRLVQEDDCDLNNQDTSGCTALHSASRNGFPEIAQILVENGADPYLTDNNGQTATDLARLFEQPECVQTLEMFLLFSPLNQNNDEKETLKKIQNNKIEDYLYQQNFDTFNNENSQSKRRKKKIQIKFPFRIENFTKNFSKVKTFNICVIGPHYTGKTKLVDRFCFPTYFDEYVPSVEKKRKKFVIVEGKEMLLNIIDICGKDVYHPFWEKWISQSDGFIFTASTDTPIELFKELIMNKIVKLICQIKNIQDIKLIPSIVTVCKCDLTSQKDEEKKSDKNSKNNIKKKIINTKKNDNLDDQYHNIENSYKIASDIALEISSPFFKSSAKNNVNINLVFQEIVNQIYKLDKREELIEREEKELKMKKETEKNEKRIRRQERLNKRTNILNNQKKMRRIRKISFSAKSKYEFIKDKISSNNKNDNNNDDNDNRLNNNHHNSNDNKKNTNMDMDMDMNMNNNMNRNNDIKKKDENKPIIPFMEIIENPELQDVFEKYLKSRYCEENLLFIRDVNKFKLIDANEKALIILSAKRIFNDYVSTDSEFQINIEGSVRDQVTKKVNNSQFDEEMFQSAYISVLGILKNDSYPGFLHSEYYNFIIQNLL
ncbi:ankyrin repeat [Anaeramoeba flamelloides]|uniref:Ankyrin repeat n=1 Tax=Anaeramoeba flamelloides TaxID=1746091 RepID=A0ABQ8XL82_9EUKA|nr:ankyrin repeat [Anaeramoeba flamelloides]